MPKVNEAVDSRGDGKMTADKEPSSAASNSCEPEANCLPLKKCEDDVEEPPCAKGGDIKRHLSKRRTSLVDSEEGAESRRSSLTEEAALLDGMLVERMKGQRRKSSLGLSKLPDLPEGEVLVEILEENKPQEDDNNNRATLVERPRIQSMKKDNRRELWRKAGPPPEIPRPPVESSSSSEESSDDESSDVTETSSGDSSSEEARGRFTPPATTIPRFRKYHISDFQFLKVLGKGSFGKVLLAELKGSEFYYAVKCLKKDVVLEDDDVECTMIERKVLALGTGHPYLCHLFCTFQTESHLFFVMEYLNGGDLMFHIQQSGRFDEGRARFYAAEIVSGLKFLHKKGIVYRDLKLDNVLLDYDGHVRIADFGMCKLQIYLDKTADTFCGTPDYMAPEIIKGLKYNQCVDWWSFGILLYEMLVGQSPFSGCDEDDLFWSICNERPHIPRYLSSEGKSILLALLEKDWSKRLGSSEAGPLDVMDHDFFSGLKWGLLDRRLLDPPFKPSMKHALDTKYFDRAFTSEIPRLTPVDKDILQSMDQAQFEGFSYTNPNATTD